MPTPRLLASLHALTTLPGDLRECVAESMRRDAKAQAMLPTQSPVDPSRVSMTAHLREVLVERGLLAIWRQHFAQSRDMHVRESDEGRHLPHQATTGMFAALA